MRLAGGADIVQQYLRAGLLDRMQLHVSPLLLGDGVRLFEEHGRGPVDGLELERVTESPTGVVHLDYRAAG